MIAVGGGSAIDLAKAAGALATNGEGPSVVDYLEGVGRGLSIVRPPLPLLAMPTTGGTGTEATKNAVISSYDPPFKKSLRSDLMVPRVVLVDPELASRSRPNHGRLRHGCDHAVPGKLPLAPCEADGASAGGRRLARAGPAILTAVQQPANRSRARRWPMRRCSRAWHWRTPGWEWRTAWRRRWACWPDAAWAGLRRDAAGGACRESPTLPGSNWPSWPASCGANHGRATPRRPTHFVSRIDELCRAVGVPRRLRDIDVHARADSGGACQASHGNSLEETRSRSTTSNCRESWSKCGDCHRWSLACLAADSCLRHLCTGAVNRAVSRIGAVRARF